MAIFTLTQPQFVQLLYLYASVKWVSVRIMEDDFLWSQVKYLDLQGVSWLDYPTLPH